MLKRLISCLWTALRSIPGEDGLCEYREDDPHDPQVQRRSIPDDNFNFERWKP